MTNRLLRWPLACCALLAALSMLLSSHAAFAQKDKGDGKLTFEVYQDKGKEYRWRLKSANGRILAVAHDGYKNKADVKSAIESIQKGVGKMKVEYYQDKSKEYRWRLVATNGRDMGRSSEGYKTKDGAEKGFELVRAGAKAAEIEEKK